MNQLNNPKGFVPAYDPESKKLDEAIQRAEKAKGLANQIANSIDQAISAANSASQVGQSAVKCAFDWAASLAPLLGDLKDWQEAITGQNLITGETLSTVDRVVTALAGIVPILPAKWLREILAILNRVYEWLKAQLKTCTTQSRAISAILKKLEELIDAIRKRLGNKDTPEDFPPPTCSKNPPTCPAVIPTPDDLPKGPMPPLNDNGFGLPYGALSNIGNELSSLILKGWRKGKGSIHFEKHGAEMGFSTLKQYTDAAIEFARKCGNIVEAKVGNILFKYDYDTNWILIVSSKERTIITFYKAKDGYNSFLEALKQHIDVLENL
ncbi:pre-toxin TG domain-containing protein [Planctomicrobium sp. SH661]|uniref:pre-toxin TG domain-containing protein n=1 Tax=Planctomicrobium sp. SH661 TaxID=3448124 RepID=UPI003F5BBC2C